MSSFRFVVSSLDNIAASKDASRNKQLGDLVSKTQSAIKQHEPELPDPEVVFAPLQLAAQTGSIPTVTAALDCIGKLISYSYFTVAVPITPPATDPDTAASSATDPATTPSEPPAPLIERAIDTICDSFQGETTAPEIQLQIVKSLLAAVLNDKIVVHGAGLLKAVRQVYNVFLLSRSPSNQQVAQGTLTQMVGTVFERVKTRLSMKEARSSSPKSETNETSTHFDPAESVDGVSATADDVALPSDAIGAADAYSARPDSGQKLTLKDLEQRKSFDDSTMGDGPTMVTQLKPKRTRSTSEQAASESVADEAPEAVDAEDEVYIKDAYLVFRSFCNLSTKVLAPDQLYDSRGQPMRSKLISLHLIHTLLNNNITVFTSPLCTITNTKSNEPTSFLQAIKYYLCLSITRNGASSNDRVFEVCCDIFWLIIKFMRADFKKEIEVFLNEIYLALLARRNAPASQKLCFVGILNRLCAEPRALVECYLNYDCDRNVDNIFQTIIEDLSRLATSPVPITSAQEQLHEGRQGRSHTPGDWQSKGSLPPPLSVNMIVPPTDTEPDVPKDYFVKRAALDALVETLRSMVNWSESGRPGVTGTESDADKRGSVDDIRVSIDPSVSDSISRIDTPIPPSTPVLGDDPEQLEKEKARKTAMTNAIKIFNFKPKKGMALLLKEGFIPSDSPHDIAQFLLAEDRLDKAQIGEFLGEGDPKNIEIMHAFVDAMDFTKKRFVDALRRFLQSFRLPGEAQKIDRFMLKFANRYLAGNPNAFANADTAYILAYSVILLNTDLHSSKIARRMTKEDFIKNNRGINDSADLPDEYLISIYEEIAGNEIVLKSEREAAAAAGTLPVQPTGLAAGLGQAFSNVGRDLQREAYIQQSNDISQRSEQLFRDLFRSQRRNAVRAGVNFIPATSFKHVGPMFDVTWMSFFSALSSQTQKTQNLEVNKLCLDGMRLATKIACLFDLSTPREAFISALKNTTNLNNLQDVFAKNVEALKVLLDLGQSEGNLLKSSWKDILMCISQLERVQLITGGVDESSVPDVSKARFVPPSRENSGDPRRSTQARRRPRANTAPHNISAELAFESRSDEVVKSIDRIFTNTALLSGAAMVHFSRALTEVSWDEIKVSGSNDQPRMYSLQKIVEISYYNMTRVRFEWTNIWDVLGEHFNKVGCHVNEAVAFFALDSLRQLSKRFMEIEELPGFKFQKDFLKPFEYVMANSSNIHVKDMCLRCLVQMIQANGENIRSGWRTMFGVFTVAARDPSESIVNMAFENVTQVYKTRFGLIISQGAFTDLIVCLTEFSKNMKFQKRGLQAMESLKSIIPRMLKTPECPLSHKGRPNTVDIAVQSPAQTNRTSVEEGFWFPVLFAFHDVLMTGEDLEVRSNALNYFFEALLRHGKDFPKDFWDILWRQQLEPIFMVLRSKPEMNNALNHEELSVWLSTTMIQALRNMITLFTHYFDPLEYMLDRFLELLALCICQENDTIARIGSNCLQQLILQNVTKFTDEHWSKIVGAFWQLFERTTAYQLFAATAMYTQTPLSPVQDSINMNDAINADLDAAAESKPLHLNGDGRGGDSDSNTATSPMAQSATGKDLEMVPDGGITAKPNAEAAGEPKTPQLEEFKPSGGLQQQPVVVTAARRRFFNRIITRCVLQLLMIETVNELFSNDAVYAQIPSSELLRLMALLKRSYLFARRFNGDKDLRMRLWREGFMKQPPNLLKQESGSAATYIAILFRLFSDTSPARQGDKADVENALVPLCKDIIKGYLLLDEETMHRNIVAWRPVVVDVLEGYAAFPEPAFINNIKSFYPLIVELLGKELSGDLRSALLLVLRRVGEVGLGIEGMSSGGASQEGGEGLERRDSLATVDDVSAEAAAAAAAAAGGPGDMRLDESTDEADDDGDASNNALRVSLPDRTGDVLAE